MGHRGFPVFLLGGLVLFLISGCAYPISKEWRKEAKKDLTFLTVIQNPDAYVGDIVIWGGLIIKTLNPPDGAELLVLENPLESNEFPDTKTTYGQFIAKSSTFLDPVIYQRGRMVTVAGEIIGKRVEPLGVMKYTYPLIRIKQLYLWEKERPPWEPPAYHGWEWNFYAPFFSPYYDDPYSPDFWDIWNE
jgi:outer membrane lipoprotein